MFSVSVLLTVSVICLPSVLSQLTFLSNHSSELNKGDICNITNGVPWTCQHPENCPSALEDLRNNKKPAICFYEDKTPIICCRNSSARTNEFISRGSISEGNVCNETKEGVWTCQRPSRCPSAIEDLKENRIPAICSYDGDTPIICCRNNSTHEPLKTSKSAEACRQYQSICNEAITFTRFATPEIQYPPMNMPPIISGMESAPQENSNPNLGPFGVIGGIASAPKEHPQMKRPRLFPTVIGGVISLAKEYPHMALIGYGEANSISWQCGGSLISARFILSAAHCTKPSERTGPARWARLGDLNIATNKDDARPLEFAITSRINHPEYKPPQLYNDIALYKLNQSVSFSPYIVPACLNSDLPQDYEKVIATGWGRIGPSAPKSKDLMKVQISIIPQYLCSGFVIKNHQLPRGIDEETMICAGELLGGKDTCEGDSGGPLISQGLLNNCVRQQIGITSFGKLCGIENSPGVYTRVSAFIPWIESIVWP